MTATVAPAVIPVAGASFVRPSTAGVGVRLYGSSSGYVGLKPAAAAGSTDYTLPSADGTSGQVLQTNGSGILSWVTVSGASPGGSGTELQYRSGASTFGAVTGSSTANGGIAIALQSASQVGHTITLASGQTADGIQVRKYGGSTVLFAVGPSGALTAGPTVNNSTGLTHAFYDGYGNAVVQIGAAYQLTLLSGGAGNAGIRHDSLGYCLGSGTALNCGNSFRIRFSSTSNWYDTADTGLSRNAAGVVEVNNGTAGTYRDLRCRNVILSTSTPASASDTGVTGTIAWDSSYLYVCTATNTWKRASLATW